MGTQMCFLAQKAYILSIICPQNETQRIYVQLASELNSMLKMKSKMIKWSPKMMEEVSVTAPEKHTSGWE